MRTHFNKALYTLVILFLSIGITNGQLYINEFLASNSNGITDEAGDFEDWIEIYNAGNSDVNLAGYYISDNLANPLAWQIPTSNASLTTVPAGGFLLLWADKDTDDGENHIDIKLGSSGEDIVLVQPDGITIEDQYTFSTQTADVSFGRIPNGGSSWDFFAMSTPGESNDTPPGAPQVAKPIASINGGFYTGNVQITLTTTTSGANIYYTTDGSIPTENSTEYNSPISFSENTSLRIKAFLDPLVPSDTQTETYLFDIDHTVPVIAYTADPDEMFDPSIGMYTNYEDDIEINVNVEMYESDGTAGFNQIVESEINGKGSASNDQKSLALKAKSSLGSATIDYQIFPLSDEDKYRSLIIRNSGQDNNITQFRDVVATSLFWDVTDINNAKPTIEKPEVYGQAYRPSVSYINGEYWGILNIRERIDKRYIKVHFDLDDNEIDYIENKDEAKEGDLVAWDELTDFLEDNSLSSDDNFQFVKDRVDLDHYIDYIAFNLYIDNADWPGNNVRRFRERADDAKWRYLTYDLDFSLGLFVDGQDWNSGYNNANALGRLLEPNSNSWPNPSYATLLFRRLMENDGWRTEFVNTMADQLNLLYNDDRLTNRINDFQAEYAPEIEQHIDRWTGYLQWEEKVQILRDFADGRTDNVRDHFIDEIDEINGIADITINLNNASQGEVELSTIAVHDQNAPFTGTYFRGVDIPVSAFPNRGYVLQNWSGDLSGNNPFETININSTTNITANFGFGSTATDPIVINEINYNSSDALNSDDWIELYNPNTNSVDISGWYFEDEGGNFFGLPANTIIPANGYLVLVENASKFSAIYPLITNFIGDFGRDPRGFGLSGGGELITLKNANGVLVDEVDYDDKAPWPVEADGNGPTLQLISPNLDNTLAASWEALPATPAALNGTNTGQQNQVINFPSIPNQFTTNPPFQINPSATSGLPVSLTILSGPASLSGNTITLNGTPGTVTVQASQAGNSTWNPALPVTQSFNVTTPPVGGGDYCDAEGSAPWHEWIAGVQLNDLNHTSGKNKYSDFTINTATLDAGETYDITLTAGYSWTTYPEHFSVWIDYNQDFIFSPSEVAYTGLLNNVPNGTPTGSITGSINIPGDALTGATRMRVSMAQGGYAEPCGSFPFGEVEDYTIIINEGNGAILSVNDCPNNIVQTAEIGESSRIINWAPPTASSTCEPDLVNINQVSGPSNGSAFDIGSTTTITYTISDQCGNQETCSFTITINAPDNGSITLSNCPNNFEIVAEPGQNGAIVNWTAPNGSSSCPIDGFNINQIGGAPNGSFFDIGTYQIVYSATDDCGNEETCVFNFTVLLGSSEITLTNCPDDFEIVAEPGQNGATVNWTAPSGSTTCPNGGLEINQIGGAPNESFFDIGTYQIVYSATDDCGNEETCIFNFTVLLGSSEITLTNCPDDFEIVAEPGQNGATVNWIAPSGSTTCPNGGLEINQIGGAPSGSFFNVGTYQIVYRATDNCGNEEICIFNFTILPGNSEITLTNCPGDFSIPSESGQNGATVNWTTPNGSTTCPNGGLEINQIGGAPNGSFFDIGTYQIIYSATDDCGNEETCIFNFTILPDNMGGDYCESSSGFPWHDWIEGVQLNTINNVSSKTTYSDYTNISTTLLSGSTYDITLTTGYSWTTFDEYWKVWIDYNQNGVFEEPAELVYSEILEAPSNGTENASVVGSITIPSNAPAGSTRMRVSMNRDNYSGPCELFGFGEVEDYTIIIPGSINGGSSSAFIGTPANVKLFPNPATRAVTLLLPEEMEVEQLKVFDVTTKQVLQIEGQEATFFYRFDVNKWMKGMYFVQLQLKDGRRITKRFIVNGN